MRSICSALWLCLYLKTIYLCMLYACYYTRGCINAVWRARIRRPDFSVMFQQRIFSLLINDMLNYFKLVKEQTKLRSTADREVSLRIRYFAPDIECFTMTVWNILLWGRNYLVQRSEDYNCSDFLVRSIFSCSTTTCIFLLKWVTLSSGRFFCIYSLP